MRNFILFISLLSTLSLFSQSENGERVLSAKCAIQQTMGGVGYWQVSITNFSDPGGQVDATAIDTFDYVQFSDSGTPYALQVVGVVSAVGNTATVKLSNVGITGISSVPTTSNATWSRRTENFGLTPWPANITGNDAQLNQEYTMYKIDSILGTFSVGSDIDYITTDSFATFTNGASFSSIPIGKTVWSTTRGSKWEKTASGTMTRRSQDNGSNALLGFTQAGSTLIFNSRLYNRVKLNTGDISAATISNPTYYTLQDNDEVFHIGITTGTSDVVLTWGSIYGVFNNTTYDTMPTITVPAQSTMYFQFRVVWPSAESVKFRYVDGVAGSGSASVTGTNIDVLYSGQSNMVGVNYVTYPPNPAIFWQTNPRLKVALPNGTFQTADPAVGNIVPGSGANILNIPFFFGSRAVQDNPLDTVRLVGFAGGGIPIERWTPATSGSVGETADNFCLDSLRLKLNRMPSGTNVRVFLWHQGESGSGNATYLTKLFSVYDTIIRHSKVADDMVMIIGDYSELLPAAPHVPIDSIRFGTKDLGGRKIYVASYQHQTADQLYDATTHFDANFMAQVGEGYYSTWNSRVITPKTDLTVVTLDAAYNNSGSSPTVTVDGNGGSNGLLVNMTGANGLIFDLQNTTGTARFRGLRSGLERSTWFRPDGRAVFNASTATPETPLMAGNSANVIIDMGAANESNLWLHGTNIANLALETHSATPNSGLIGFQSRGSASSPSFSSDGDRALYISSRSWGGGANTTYVEGAKIEFKAVGTWGFSNRSHNIYLGTNTTGTSTMVDRMQIGDLVTSLVGFRTNSAIFETADVTYTATGNAIGSNERYINIDATSNNVGVTLPTAEDGRILTFRRVDNTANTVTFTGTINGTVNPTSAGTVIGSLATQYGVVSLRGNGTSWERWNNPLSGGGTGDILNGGNSGVVTVGSNDNTLNLEAGGTTWISTTSVGNTTLTVNDNTSNGFVMAIESGGANILTANTTDGAEITSIGTTSVGSTLTLASETTRINGSQGIALRTISASGTSAITNGDFHVRLDATTGSKTLTLPTPTYNMILQFFRFDNNPATVITFTGTINGSVNPTTTGTNSPVGLLANQYSVLELKYNGTSWEVNTGTGDILNNGNAGAVVIGSNSSTTAIESNGTTRLSFGSTGDVTSTIPDNTTGALLVNSSDGQNFITATTANAAPRLVLGSAENGGAIGQVGIRYEDVQSITSTGSFTATKSTIGVNLTSTGTVTADLTGWPTSTTVASNFTIINVDALGAGVDVTVALTGATWHSGSNPVLTPGQSVNCKLINGVLYIL